jgi:hypothetical protein
MAAVSSFARNSCCDSMASASRLIDSARLPARSPARTRPTYDAGKALGCAASASAKVPPRSTRACTSASAMRSELGAMSRATLSARASGSPAGSSAASARVNSARSALRMRVAKKRCGASADETSSTMRPRSRSIDVATSDVGASTTPASRPPARVSARYRRSVTAATVSSS